MNEKLLRKYARLIAGVGVNVQKGQPVIVNCPVECAPFARMLTDECYALGAKDVIVNWRDDYCNRQHWLYADDSLFDRVYEWDALKLNTLGKAGAAYIAISASDPENLKGVDSERLRRYDVASGRDLKEFYRLEMSNGFPWCVASVPVKSWSEKVFPDLFDGEAEEKLWDAIFKAVRIDEENDPVEAWRTHCDLLKERSEKLNSLKLKSVRYKNSLGTDLTVGLPKNHVWMGGGDTSQSGIGFVANMPTEEIFSAPEKNSVNGVVYASKPLVLNGNLIENIKFEFRDGRIVDMDASSGLDALRASVDIDEGSHYLGEIALVPYNSPISESGILFYNTLFDENASCHFAFGEAYPSCIEGGDFLSLEELNAAGINAESSTHVDFMVGTKDLSIIGTTESGDTVTIFENGNFAL